MEIEHATTEKFKSGIVVVTEDSSAPVSFITPFKSVPVVTVTPISTEPTHGATVDNITVNGFDVFMNKQGGGQADDITVMWVASDMGNL